MAQRTQVTLTCDLEASEKPASETIRFAVDGAEYEMDLCDKHAKQFRDLTAPFVGAARRLGRPRARGRASHRGSGKAGGDRHRATEVRAWARKNGIAVNERGRLGADVVAKYEASRRR